MRLYFTLIIVFALLAMAFIFGSQNEQMITLNYLIARSEISVAMAVSLFTILGFVLGMLTVSCWTLLRVLRKKRQHPENNLVTK